MPLVDVFPNSNNVVGSNPSMCHVMKFKNYSKNLERYQKTTGFNEQKIRKTVGKPK